MKISTYQNIFIFQGAYKVHKGLEEIERAINLYLFFFLLSNNLKFE